MVSPGGMHSRFPRFPARDKLRRKVISSSHLMFYRIIIAACLLNHQAHYYLRTSKATFQSIRRNMSNEDVKPEFWEVAFTQKQEMWGLEPAPSVTLAKDMFVQNNAKNILVPGIGYGRNGQVFKECGMKVTGIEISKTAIDMARKHYGDDMIIHHGSVCNMPFDALLYDGVFCYALIHLLDSTERVKLIQDCYNQLKEGGIMVFVAISKEASMYGKGTFIEKDRYENHGGAKVFFYDTESVHAEFDSFGLFDVVEIAENHPFFIIKCRK